MTDDSLFCENCGTPLAAGQQALVDCLHIWD
ncbi:MAG: hypothetical protein K6E91_09535 [Butyrivibrio sp.]|nr:hypothetical protein [Butyrivibrio sp.]